MSTLDHFIFWAIYGLAHLPGIALIYYDEKQQRELDHGLAELLAAAREEK